MLDMPRAPVGTTDGTHGEQTDSDETIPDGGRRSVQLRWQALSVTARLLQPLHRSREASTSYIQQWQIKQNTNVHNHYTRNQNEFYIVGTKHAFAKQCLKNNLPNTLNATPQIVKYKLFTHSFHGFTIYVKYNFIQNYPIICTVTNCYTCMRN